MPSLVKKNDHGRRIGEGHPRAVLTDHEIDLLIDLLIEREALIGRMEFDGATQVQIDAALMLARLSYRCLAVTFGLHKQTVAKIAKGQRRCQCAA